jgi:hypothetical protein
MSDPIDVWIVMNESGDYEVGRDEETAIDRFDAEEFGGLYRRLVRFKVTMSPPEAVEVDLTVPDEAGKTVAVETD